MKGNMQMSKTEEIRLNVAKLMQQTAEAYQCGGMWNGQAETHLRDMLNELKAIRDKEKTIERQLR